MVEPVETYTTEWQTQAEMLYNGLGNRLEMTAHAGGQSATTQYELDGNRVLSADSDGNVTTYIYGLGLIRTIPGATPLKHTEVAILPMATSAVLWMRPPD